MDLRTYRNVENPAPAGKAIPAGVRRVVLGERSNFVAKPRKSPKGVKPMLVQSKRAPVVPEVVPAAPVVQVQTDVSMREEDELCQAFSETLCAIEDIDRDDTAVLPLCSEYVNDIYTYLRHLEAQQPIRPRYMEGYDLNERMRALLLDWLIQVHSRFQLLQETLYMTVAIIDRFLQVQPVSRRKLQLVGVTAMWVACKFEEMYVPEVGDFAYITDNAYTKSQICAMEELILKALNFDLGRPLPLHFLRRASKAGNADPKVHILAKYLLELNLLDYDMVHYLPSETGAAALCLSQLVLTGQRWSPTQEHYTTYSEAHLRPIMQHLAKNVIKVNENLSKFVAIKNKYSSMKLMEVSKLKQLQSPLLRDLASPLLPQ